MVKFYVLLFSFGILLLYLVGKRWRQMQRRISDASDDTLLKTFMAESQDQESNFRRTLLWGTQGYFHEYIHLFRHREAKILLRNVGIVIGVIAAIYTLNSFVIHFNAQIVIPISCFIGLSFLKRFERKLLKKSFDTTFPEALTMINGAISAGKSITQAMQECAAVMPEPLGEEFGKVSRRLNVGETPEKVLYDSYKRLPYKEYYFFTIAILVNLKSGARLRDVLVRLGKTVANAKAMERKKYAMTSEARMSSKITAIIPFAFLFLLQFLSPVNYEYVMYNPDGAPILYYFLGSELIGMLIVMFLMRKL